MRLPQQNRPGKPTRTRRNVPCWHSGDGLAFVAGAKVAGAGTDGLCAGGGVLFLKTRWTGAADNFSSGFGGRHCMNGDPGGILRRGERTWSGFPLGRLARAFAWQRLLAVSCIALCACSNTLAPPKSSPPAGLWLFSYRSGIMD